MAEQTKDQLQALVNQLTTDLANSKNDVLNLTQERDSQRDALTLAKQSIADLQQQLTDERTRSGDLAADLNESEQLTEELQAKLKRAETIQAESDTLIVSDGTDDYKVLLKSFKFKHVTYKSEELKDNQALVQQLVAAGVGFLQKIEPKNEE